MKKSFIVFSLVTLLMAGFANKVWAKFSITPSRIEGKFPAGRSYENCFEITNYEETSTVIKISSSDRTLNPLTKDWFTLHESSVELAPGETRKVKYTIAIPENASGEYNAWAVFTGEPIANIMGGAGIAVRNSIPIYIAIKGTEKFDFEISTLSISNKNNLAFTIYLKNTGNIHIRTTGTIQITSLDRSNENYILPFNEIKWAIIPNEVKDYESKAKEPFVLQDGAYKAVINLTAGDDTGKKEFQHELAFTVSGSSVTITEGKIEQKSTVQPQEKAKPKKPRKLWSVEDPYNKPRKR
ncbi:MAG: hypothetical protein H7A34_06040 [bacterium]|nr:hypothetical protein [bacterium]